MEKDSHTISATSSSACKEGETGTNEEVSVSQAVITPLASGTLHKNLIQDIKEGKLGDVPQVVIVHPDGSQEEISSKYAVNDRWTVVDEFTCASTREPSSSQTAIPSVSKSPDISLCMSVEAVESVAAGESLFDHDSKEEATCSSLNSREGDLCNQNESSQHCEAATQVEIESDADSSSDNTSPHSTPNEKNSAQQVSKVVPENVGSHLSQGLPAKSSLGLPELTQALKTSSSNAPFCLKTLVTKPSGKKFISETTSPHSSSSSTLKVTQTASAQHQSPTHNSSSAILGSIPHAPASVGVSHNGVNSAMTSDPMNSEKDSRSKVYVSLSGISGEGCKPPVQLLSGDVNVNLPLATDNGQGDPAQGFVVLEGEEVDEMSFKLETDDNASEIQNSKSVVKETLTINSQTQEKSSDDHDSRSSPSDQTSVQNLPFPEKSTTLSESTLISDTSKSQTQAEGEDLSLLTSVNQQSQSSSSGWVQDSHSSNEQDSSWSVDHTLISAIDQESHSALGQTEDPFIHTDNVEEPLSKQRSQSTQKMVPFTERDVMDVPENSHCDIPKKSTLSDSSSSGSVISKLVPGGVCDNLQPDDSMNTSSSITLSLPGISVEPKLSSDSNATDISAEDAKSSLGEQPSSKSKSKGRTSKKRTEPDPTLVMTGKRQRKALVKVSL